MSNGNSQVDTDKAVSAASENSNTTSSNGNKLRHVDAAGQIYYYAKEPMLYSVIFILAVEWLERFSYYGVYYTQTMYWTGAYNEDWNPGLSSVDAASLVSLSTAMAYTTPFVGAVLADSILGDYKSILVGCLVFYGPSLICLTLTTIPYYLSETDFPTALLAFVLLVWWPLGTGIVKASINVFGAKQFHPIYHTDKLEQYYVIFYMAINVGSLVGITVVPIIAQRNVTIAYLLPSVLLLLGVVCFVAGTNRYIRMPPKGKLCGAKKKSNAPNDSVSLLKLFRITVLIVPFCMAYSQMPTTFIVQGRVMKPAWGVVDAATLNSSDAASVLVFGFITGSWIYPALNKRGIKIPTTVKFAIGSALGALALLWSLWVEYYLRQQHAATGETISVLWQTPAYILIGWGEIFAVSSAYEVAFTAAPPSQKVVASALNIFCIGGIPNVVCIGLYRLCRPWFYNASGQANLNTVQDYTEASIYKYFVLLLAILVAGVGLNLIPAVRQYVQDMEDEAAEATKTPLLVRQRFNRPPGSDGGESSPLLPKHLQGQQSPLLYRTSSMRVGPPTLHPHRHEMQSKFQKRLQKYLPSFFTGKSPKGPPTAKRNNPANASASRKPSSSSTPIPSVSTGHPKQDGRFQQPLQHKETM